MVCGRRWTILYSLIFGILITSCSQSGSSDQLPMGEQATESIQVLSTSTRVPPSSTASPEPTVTGTSEPTPSPTLAPRLSVSQNSNCRAGPATNYLYQGVLLQGEYADVLAKSTESDYWYITSSQLPEEGCWLWGEFAQVEGDIEALPVYTPEPSPMPAVGFEVYLKSFQECGSTQYVVFAVKNVGGARIWSGYIEVQDWVTGKTLYKERERHPFAASVLPVCPPGHGNELWPGEVRYIHAPISPVEQGHTAVGIITLCTADHQGGTCPTEYSYFELP